jgi:prepilin-type N-terminal cleavage/methylation domain-containing protein
MAFGQHDGTLQNESGFSLVETLIAMAILATGLLSLAGVFIMGLAQLSGSSASLIAREKAREAVESVHTARDTKTIAWCQIRNFGTPTNCADGAPGAFLAGEQQLRTAGDDGLVNTDDDGDVEVTVSPGYDNVMGTDDDRLTPLDNYRREVQITDIIMPNGQANPNLRQLRVIISYRVGPSLRTYTLTTFISAIS